MNGEWYFEPINSENHVVSHHIKIPGDDRSFIGVVENAFVNLTFGDCKKCGKCKKFDSLQITLNAQKFIINIEFDYVLEAEL